MRKLFNVFYNESRLDNLNRDKQKKHVSNCATFDETESKEKAEIFCHLQMSVYFDL